MNQKSIIAILGVVVVILIGTTVYFASINKANQPVSPDPKVVQQPAPTPAVQQPAQQVPSSDIATNKTPEQIVRGVLTPEQKATNPEITIVKATDSFIKANLFFNPGGYYILAAKVNGEWKKVLDGNSIPKCKEIAQYNFPKDIVPSCE